MQAKGPISSTFKLDELGVMAQAFNCPDNGLRPLLLPQDLHTCTCTLHHTINNVTNLQSLQ